MKEKNILLIDYYFIIIIFAPLYNMQFVFDKNSNYPN